jgi:hypothetical protein
VVYVHFAADTWFPYYYLHGPCILDEYETLHPGEEEKSVEVFVREKLLAASYKLQAKLDVFIFIPADINLFVFSTFPAVTRKPPSVL